MARCTFFSLTMCVALASSHPGGGGEPSPQNGPPNKYRDLIGKLVSPNEKPITRNGSDASVRFPKEYDVAAQVRILEARQVLHDNFEEALPFLVAALDDERYCMTVDWAEGDAYYNWSVGGICRNVIEAHLEVYRRRIAFDSPQQWNRFNYPITKEWWDARKGRSLAQLQVEAIDWAIERAKGESDVGTSGLAELRHEIARSTNPAKPLRMLRAVKADRK